MTDNWKLFEQSATSSQLLAVLIGTLGTFSDGMHYGWTAPTIEKLKETNSTLKIQDEDVVQLEGLYLLGGLIGLPFNIQLPDRIGRKKSIMVASSISFLGWLLIIFAKNINYIVAARILIGIAGNLGYTCTPMYIAEVAHPNIRGFLTEMVAIMELLGVVFIYSIAPFVPIYIPAIFGGLVLLVQIFSFPFMPESPYFALYKGKEKKAEVELKRLRRDSFKIDEEISEISSGITQQKKEKFSIVPLFQNKGNRKALLLMILLNASQHFSGISVILMNLHVILNSAGVTNISKELAAILFSIVLLVSTIASSLLVDKFGRKTLLTLSYALLSVCLFAIATRFHFGHAGPVGDFSLVACTIFYAVSFELGLGSIPIVLLGELFPFNVKATGMTISDISFVLIGVSVIYLYNYLLNSHGLAVCFYLFAMATVFFGMMAKLFVPETKGKTLEEIQQALKV